MPINEPIVEFTQHDFDIYKAKIALYDKIIDEGGMLSEKEVEYLKDLRMELGQRYTQASLSQYHIVGYINSALSLDDVRKTHKVGMEMDEERKDLEARLDKGRANGTISEEEGIRMSKRRDEICYFLDPTHFHGSPPF